MYRNRGQILEVLLAHPGGPYWANKDNGAWSIPKGEYEDDECPSEAAKREFMEETGIQINSELLDLGVIKQPSGKLVIAWATEGDCAPTTIVSNTFSIEWPPKSGKNQEFPEIDRVDWFDISMASIKILKGQIGFLKNLCGKLGLDHDSLAASTSNKDNSSSQMDLFQ